jgi:two-component system phosphate regulon response regulator PhoB
MSESKKAKKILVIDDEVDTVIYMETLLQDNGYETVSASDGQEGMDKAKTEKPDLVVLDVSMPQKSGMRFFKEIKSDPELESIPVIMVTGVTGFGGDKEALKKFMGSRGSLSTPEGFFPKPIDREEFLKTVAKLLP